MGAVASSAEVSPADSGGPSEAPRAGRTGACACSPGGCPVPGGRASASGAPAGAPLQAHTAHATELPLPPSQPCGFRRGRGLRGAPAAPWRPEHDIRAARGWTTRIRKDHVLLGSVSGDNPTPSPPAFGRGRGSARAPWGDDVLGATRGAPRGTLPRPGPSRPFSLHGPQEPRLSGARAANPHPARPIPRDRARRELR